ncbi:MAG TPA: hypothetical protein VK427_15740, partial [Kofleriaceae bacterium]|nr:hypothetical protein [Kofleriaceae bacterium]
MTVVEADDDPIAAFAQHEPAAVLLDIDPDGYDVCRRVRALPGGDAAAILVMTASDDAVTRAIEAGATDCLARGDLAVLAHRVATTLRGAEASRQARVAVQLLERTSRLARLVHWRVDASGHFEWQPDAIGILWPDANAYTCEHLVDVVHPDDQALVHATMASRASHKLQFRLLLPDGSVRHVLQEAELDGDALVGATQDVTDVRRAEQQIAQLAFYDDICGVPNRQFLEHFLARADARAPWTVIAIDVGRLEQLAIPVARRAAMIRTIVARVIERVRGTDRRLRLDQEPIAPERFDGRTIVSRITADEIIVASVDPAVDVVFVRRLADALAVPAASAMQQQGAWLRPRYGVARMTPAMMDVQELVEAARAAMLEAERVPPRDIVQWNPAHRRANGPDLAARLSIALDQNADLDMIAMPRHAGDRHVGQLVETRWKDHPQSDVAAAFAAEPTLRRRLARFTLIAALRDAVTWSPELGLALEAGDLEPAFVTELLAHVDHASFPRERIELVLARVPAEHDMPRTVEAIGMLREARVRVALTLVDDRCTLRELRVLSVDTLRIDAGVLAR